ncbi:ribosomal protein L22 (BL17) [Tepidanaerobacter acetatoxydans Re1]|uniref:Large ribosomal subunit protein uL22 n=1 Tax=Tepidanaerobacter acetatoxydans (strain DSM 21804 / JCM 16047 / Re1) TaxID=1209989 RepID=F4LSU0_TEPAE|nr:50S ribosomal protein L22 [Tepidanaerobacter acetatoxydans]AEE90403.1 ribosomal protein L22 [Tepidanaerobacter acetatoxydans Re1]CCP24897.1 ribosomal protein L22 (BL17) [Tepidanaerobacter acetatoxydans Re1]
MEARAQARYVRIAPRKVRVVLDLIRGKQLEEALNILRFTPKAASRPLEKLLRSAAANAENNFDMNMDALYVAECYADQGPILKRFRPRAQGRAASIHKKTSHITIVLKEKEG